MNQHKHYKCFSPKHGRYFYYLRNQQNGEASGITTWDKPKYNVVCLTDASINLHSEAICAQASRDSDHKSLENGMAECLNLVEEQKLKYQRQKSRQELVKRKSELQEIDVIWKSACDQGKVNGRVQLLSKDVLKRNPHLSIRLMSFKEDYGRDMSVLQLSDLGLTDETFYAPDDSDEDSKSITSNYLPCSIVELSLASNSLTKLPKNVLAMGNLTRLNLTRNKLSELPCDFHTYLINLEFINLSNNLLRTFSVSLGLLHRLKELNLAQNTICELPGESYSSSLMKLNLSSNYLSVLSTDLCEKCTNLYYLNLNDNRLKHLPPNIGSMSSLRSLLVCRNRLMELPSTLCDIATLEVLRLDFNSSLTALPRNIHSMHKLKDLKCEGNVNMTIPPIDVILQGIQRLKRWSAMRLQRSIVSQQMTIIISTLALLQFRSKSGDEVHSIRIHDDDYNFTTEALAYAIKCCEAEKYHFPYSIDQVIDAMTHYCDASGHVAKEIYPDTKTWKLRQNLHPESYLTAKRRKQNEINLIRLAMEASEKSTLKLLSMDHGRDFVAKNSKALYYFVLSLFDDCNVSCYDSLKIDDEVIINFVTESIAFDAQMAQPLPMSNDDFSFLMKLIQNDLLIIFSSDSPQIDHTLIQMYSKKAKELVEYAQSILRQTLDFAWKHRNRTNISKLDIRMKKKVLKDDISMIQQIESYVCQHYVNWKVDKCRENAVTTNRKIGKVLSGWLGMNLETAFHRWKKWAKTRILRRLKDEMERQEAEKYNEEDRALQIHNAKHEIQKWNKEFDEFSESYYWKNKETGDITWEEPQLQNYL